MTDWAAEKADEILGDGVSMVKSESWLAVAQALRDERIAARKAAFNEIADLMDAVHHEDDESELREEMADAFNVIPKNGGMNERVRAKNAVLTAHIRALGDQAMISDYEAEQQKGDEE